MGFIDPKMWDDSLFLQCNCTEKLTWIYLITGPENQPLPGLLRIGVAGVAESVRLAEEDARSAIGHLCELGLIEFDPERRLLRIPEAPTYNKPCNPNVLRAWWRRWQQTPDSPLKQAHVDSLAKAMGEVIAAADSRVAARWQAVWAETFGGGRPHKATKQQELPLEENPEDSRAPKSFGNGSRTVSEPFSGGCGAGSGAGCGQGADDHTVTESRTEEDQGHKRFGNGSGNGSRTNVIGSPPPSPDRRSDHIPIPDPDAGAQEGAVGHSNGALRARAERAWAMQEQLRALLPGMHPMPASEANLRPVLAVLEAGATDSDVEHVLNVFMAEAEDDPGKIRWFNGIDNWKAEQFRRALGRPEKVLSKGGRYKVTGREKRVGGDVKL